MIEENFYNLIPGVNEATAIAQTINQVADAKARRDYEFALSRLDSDRQEALNKQMLRAKNQTERLQILINSISNLKAEESRARIQGKQTSERNKVILIIGGGLALLITAYLIKKV